MTARRWLLTPVAALLILLPLGAPGETTNSTFYFVQITDTHIGTDWHYERLRKTVDAINQLPMPIACVIHTGDVVSDNMDHPEKVDEGLKLLEGLKPPLHVLPGNHDILPKRLETTLKAFRGKVGPLCTAVDYHGVRFLLLYTEPLAKPITVPGYEPLLWLSQQLTKAGEKPVIVCHHRPSIEDFYNNKVHSGWPKDSRTAWQELLLEANVKAIITGHFHRDELHWLQQIPIYVGAPLAAYWKRQASFRIYRYDDGTLSYRTRYIEN